MRLLTFFATLALLLASVRANAQTTNSLHFSIQAIDRLIANSPPGEGEVQVDDMRFSKGHMQAWRNYLQSRLNGGKFALQGAFNYSGSSAWPGGVVPYVYQTTGPEAMSAAKQALVESAMRDWQQVASLNFVPRTSEQNYILFKFSGDAADAPMDSAVGMQGGAQVLNVAGWGNKLNCAHELGHALGMIHEQSRSDRDTFVTVNFDNIASANAHNFTLLPSSINRTSYDYDSMMHYPRSAFAKTNGLITITANAPNQTWSDGSLPQEIGQRRYLSNGDQAAMGLQYGTPLTISGHIQDAAGNPLIGVQVTLQSGNTYRGQNPVTTDINGNYTFTGIPRNTGNHTVTPSQLGATFTIFSQTVNMLTTSQTAVNFVQTDSAPPGLVITNPAPSGIYSSLPTAGGTASDNAGVKEVRVALARTSDLVWWNWVAGTWGTTTFDWDTNMKLATGTAEWMINLPTFADGGYQIHVQSVDNSDNASPWLLRHFFMDPTPPVVAITQPLNNANLSAFTVLKGTANDGIGTGISSNLVYFTLYNDGDFWTGFNWKSDTTAQDPDVLLSADLVAGEWTYNQLPEGSDARSGQYAISSFVKDGATNSSSPNPGVTSVLFTVDRSPPTGSVQSPANNATIDYLPSGTWFSGIASDDHAVSYVNLFIRRESDGLFWNGSGWSELSTAESIITSTLAGNSWHNNSGLPIPGASLVNGTYAFIAVIVDTAGNQKQVESAVTVAYHPTYTWTAGSFSDGDPDNNNNNWDNPANWSPHGVPSDDSKVIITGGGPYAGHLGLIKLFELDFTSGSVTFSSFQIQDGGELNWSGGALQTSLCSIPPTGTMTLSGAAGKDFPYGVITNAGTIVWTDGGPIVGGNGARIENSGLFEVTGDSYILYNNAGAGVAFNNHPAGVLRKKSSAGVTYFHDAYGGWQFNNSGTIDVQSGILSLDQGSKNLNAGGSISGVGRLRSTGGTLAVNGTTTLGSGSRLELRSGTMVGTGSFAGSGTFEWTGGGIAGGGTLTIGPSANLLLSPGDDRALYGGTTFINSGAALATLANTWIFSSSGTFVNSGLFTLQSDFTILYDNGGAAPAFVNTGTLRKSGTDGAVIINTAYGGTRFHNSGTVDIQQGTFQLGGGGTGGGTWQTSASGLTEFTGNTMTLTNGTVFTGGGTNRVNGGRVNFDAASPANVTVSGIFELLSGAWGGSATFMGAGRLGWNAGTIDGYVSIGSSLKLQIASDQEKYLGAGVITNAGSITWSGTGQFTAGSGSRVDNSGLFEAVNDAFFIYNNAGAGVAFNNHPAGVLRKKSSAGVTYFHDAYGGWQFNNSGTIDVQSGILSLDQGSKNLNDGGSISGAGRLRSTGGTLTVSGTTTLGSGSRLELRSGTMVGTGSFAGSGTFEWTGGGIAGGGTLTIGPSANLLLSPGDDRALYGGTTLNNNGTALATLANTVVLSSSATFNNNGLFILQSDFNFFYDNGGSRPSFNNNAGGTIRRNTATGEVKFRGDYGGILFQNSGLIDLQSGLLRLDSPTTINPTSNIKFALKGTTPGTEAPQLNFGGGITFDGSLSVWLTNSYTPTIGATYVLMNHAGNTGTFATPALPALDNNLAWKVNYTSTQLILEVVQAYALATPARQGDGSYTMSFTGAAATTIQFQASDNLVDWETLQTINNFTGNQSFIDSDAQLYTRRFYRVLIVP